MSDSEYSSSEEEEYHAPPPPMPMSMPAPREKSSRVQGVPNGYHSYAPMPVKTKKSSKKAPKTRAPVASRMLASGRPWDSAHAERYAYAPPPPPQWAYGPPPGWGYAPPTAARKVVKRKQSDNMRKRAVVVKQIMQEHGLSLGDASKYVKAHNLWSAT